MNNPLDWLLEPNEKVWAEADAERRTRIETEYGEICPVCHYPVNHPTVQPPDYPGQPHGTDTPHDCFTGDPLAR